MITFVHTEPTESIPGLGAGLRGTVWNWTSEGEAQGRGRVVGGILSACPGSSAVSDFFAAEKLQTGRGICGKPPEPSGSRENCPNVELFVCRGGWAFWGQLSGTSNELSATHSLEWTTAKKLFLDVV